MFLFTSMSSTAQLVSSGASLKVDCLSTPTTPTALMTAAAYANGKMVLPLIGVPVSCSGVVPGAPCATRPMFQCTVDGAPPSPPMRALLEEQRASQGELLSLSPYLECPLPADAVEGAGISVSFDSLAIPVRDSSDSVVSAINVILGPPPPSPPPMHAPPAPPFRVSTLGYYSNPDPQFTAFEDVDSKKALLNKKSSFTKKSSSTVLRLMYVDQMACKIKGGRVCSWEIQVRPAGGGNPVACQNPGGQAAGLTMVKQWFHNENFESRRSHSILGYCYGIPAGDYELAVEAVADNAYAQTGWTGLGTSKNVPDETPKQTYFLEAQEIEKEEQHSMFHFVHGKGTQELNNANTMVFYTGTRKLTFKKAEDSTPLRITWHDNFRMYQPERNCDWEIVIDRKSCPSGKLGGRIYHSHRDNDHEPDTIVGMCSGISAGDHTVELGVKGDGGCYVGWPHNQAGTVQVFTVEVDERPVEDNYLTYKVGHSQSGNTNGFVPDRDLLFVKQMKESRVRITYYDQVSMMAIGSAGACSWNVLLCDFDGANCAPCEAGAISSDLFEADKSPHTDHYFKVMQGYCDNVPPGSYHIKVEAGSTAKFVGPDYAGDHECHTGGLKHTDKAKEAGNTNHFYMEALEVPTGVL